MQTLTKGQFMVSLFTNKKKLGFKGNPKWLEREVVFCEASNVWWSSVRHSVFTKNYEH